jgi:6-pyruvoyltetrahydropterin/6-carboxytetrahydropterin synthase
VRAFRFVAEVSVDEIAAGHHLPGYPGACAHPHGHNWSFVARVGANALHADMVADFVSLKAVFKELDHTMLNDVAELVRDGRRPTTERLAEWLAGRLQAVLDTQPNRPRLISLTVAETARNRITFTPDA